MATSGSLEPEIAFGEFLVRIVSLLPSATELVAALGLTDALVGCSHECDYPARVAALPVCTYPKFDPHGNSGEIHARVTTLLQSALSVYSLHLETLIDLAPTHILTQAQCEVCAVSLGEVQLAAATQIPSQPQVISLQPNTLDDLWQDIRTTAQGLGVAEATVTDLLASLQGRVTFCQQQTATLTHRPTVVCLEWTDPLMGAGNWVPELVTWAGGDPKLGTIGQHSAWLTWDQLIAVNPEVIVLMPCGFSLTQTAAAAVDLSRDPHWATLRAVQSQRVYLVDGNQYFNRPGPRLVDSLEILAEILHPQRFRFGYEGEGWQVFTHALT
ncbi:MAG: cobalamin-binding protein [Synechococcales cyanobacterium]